MSNSIWKLIINLCGTVFVTASVFMFIVAIYPFEILTVNTPMKVITPIVEQGDCVFVEMEYEQKIVGASIVTVQVVTDDNINIANQILGLNLEPGKNIIKIGFMLPRNINFPPDKKIIKAKLKLTSRYEIYGFRNIDSHYSTENFNIKAKANAH